MSEKSGKELADDRLGDLIGRGRTAEIYRWGADRVVKLFVPGMSLAAIEREACIAAALTRSGIPAPRFDGQVSVDGRAGLLFERIEGRSMLEDLAKRPWRVLAHARQMADQHLAIHQRAADPALHPQREALRAVIMGADVLPGDVQEHALLLLRGLPDGDRTCHGDLHPDNVLLTANGSVAIDWMTATLGCPAADVARTMFLLRDAELPPGTGAVKALLMNGFRRLFAWGYWRRYQAISGMTAAEVEAWRVPVLAARLHEGIPGGEHDRLMRTLRTSIPRL